MKKIIFIVLISVSSFSLAEEKDTIPQKIFSFVPQYLGKKGVRLDYEHKVKQNAYLQICPQIYLSEKNYDEITNNSYLSEGDDYVNGLENEHFNYLTGIGLAIYYKYFPKIKSDLGFYISCGLTYNFFHINYNVVNEINHDIIERNNSINKIGGDVIIGYQKIFYNVVSVDFYTGLGTRFSYFSFTNMNLQKFNSFYSSYGFTGNILLLGIRIGLVL